MESPTLRTVLVTTPDRDVAERLAVELVEARLAACGNVVPGVTSVFRWEGEVRRADEVLLVLKTTADRLDALTSRVEDLHPYDVPEVLALPVERSNAAYGAWVAAATRPDAAGDGD